MSKQEEIREGVQELIFESWDKPVKSADLAWDILSYLHSKGVVIKTGYDEQFYETTEPLVYK